MSMLIDHKQDLGPVRKLVVQRLEWLQHMIQKADDKLYNQKNATRRHLNNWVHILTPLLNERDALQGFLDATNDSPKPTGDTGNRHTHS